MNLPPLEDSPTSGCNFPALWAASRLLCCSLLALALTLASQGQAQAQAQAQSQKLAPGHWENTTRVNLASADGGSSDAMARIQKELASMPLAQRKMMEDMLAKQGVAMGAQPNSVRMKFSCQGPPLISGEGEYTFSSDKAYSGRMTVTSSAKGQAASMDMETTGRWISADCGALKPRP